MNYEDIDVEVTAYTETHFPTLNIDQYEKSSAALFPFSLDCASMPCTLIYNGGPEPTTSTTKNYYIYKNLPASNFTNWPGTNDPLKPFDAMALDKKIDDGRPSTGIFLSSVWGSNPAVCVDGSDNYDITSSEYACTIYMEVGSQIGGL